MVGVPGRSGVGSGGPRGGGRPKGTVNSESIKLQERALASGFAPLDVLLGMMRYYYELAERVLHPAEGVAQRILRSRSTGCTTKQVSTPRALRLTYIRVCRLWT